MQDDDMELATVLVRIGKRDRELYRLLRAEAWALVAKKHETHSDTQRAAWLRSAS